MTAIASQIIDMDMRNGWLKIGRGVRIIALIVTSGSALAVVGTGRASSAEPPAGLLRKVAEREGANAQARANYTYRQSFSLQELNSQGAVVGEYQETRDVTYSPQKGRSEQLVDKPRNTLTRVKLTAEDFQDVSRVASLLLTPDQVSLYEGQYKGEETKDGERCFVEFVRPRQILSGQRFFQGTLWIRESDFSIVRSEGQAVPQLESGKEQNLFPHFTTLRRPVDNQWLFPMETVADDTLFFRDWPQRIRVNIRYSNYQRFGSESTVTYGGDSATSPPASPPPAPPAPPTPASPAPPRP